MHRTHCRSAEPLECAVGTAESSTCNSMNRARCTNRIFLLSPAHCGGRRAQMLINEAAQFELAERLRAKSASLGEIFTFLSGLYFRGKLAYSLAFARPPEGWPGAFVITTNRGLLPPDTVLT